MDHITVVLVHFNTDTETKACLDSLLKTTHQGFETQIVVVDNGSKVALKLPERLQMHSQITLLRSESNLGFSGGNTLGISHALQQQSSEYVLLLNTDTLIHPQAIEELHAFLQREREVGMVSPKIYFAPGKEFHHASYTSADKGKVLWYGGGSIDWRNLLAFHRNVDELERGQTDAQSRSEFATGCAVMIRREVLEAIGSLDDNFFLYLEDVEWSVRAARMGYQIGYCPQAVVWHLNASSVQGSGSATQVYYQTRNRAWFFWKFGSWRVKLTVARWVVEVLLRGEALERWAVTDALRGAMGKRALA
jgi:GT2 family glycosyltransferase